MGLFSNKKKEILIVDDGETNRARFAGFVPGEFEIKTAEDGLQALKKVMEHKPDLIFLDLEMPNMDGFKFITTIRENPKFKSIPIVILSAMDQFPHLERALNLGANDFIEKSKVNRNKIIEKISQYVR